MQNDIQKEAFTAFEADGWFERNLHMIQNYKKDDDIVIKAITNYQLCPQQILEIGCSAGYRLNGLKQIYPQCEVFGIEPSTKAVGFSKDNYKEVNIQQGTADDLSCYATASMDVVIVGFVFYVIDRTILFKVIAEIDRVLKNGGVLLIVDFFSISPSRNEYAHIKDFPAFSFKQDYDKIFTASHLYSILSKDTYSHSSKSLSADNDFYDKYSVTMLKKDTIAGY